MTVAELIETLRGMPQDAAVIYRCCSDWSELDADEVELVTAEDSRRAAATGQATRGGHTAIQFRGGRYVDAYALPLHAKDEEPVYVTVVCFPGN